MKCYFLDTFSQFRYHHYAQLARGISSFICIDPISHTVLSIYSPLNVTLFSDFVSSSELQGWMFGWTGLQFVELYIDGSLPAIMTFWRNQFTSDTVEALNGAFLFMGE